YTTRTLAFSVCVDSTNNIRPERAKQRWEVGADVAESERWPDFIWVPGNLGQTADSGNPFVHDAFDTIVQLQKMSAGVSGQPPVPTPVNTKTYGKRVARTIPDNAPAGISVAIAVPDAFVAK